MLDTQVYFSGREAWGDASRGWVPSEAFEGVSSGKEPWHDPWALHSGEMREASTEVYVSGEAAR